MAGVADRAFRELCRGYGAAYTVTELISAKGVSLRDKKSQSLMAISDAERPAGIQLFGSDPDTMAEAACAALKHRPDFIDINMGCPAPKVAGNGGGAALMRDPALAGRITRAVADAAGPVPVTVKIRAGWDAQSINAMEVAERCADAGASAVTVHGRTRAQMYAPSADWNIIRQVKQAVDIPVIGNGDVFTPRDAAALYETTGCDFILVGRGAMGAPWLFSQISAYLSDGTVLPDPPVSERMAVLLRQVRAMVAYKGERIALNEARKHASWYMKGLRGAAAFRRECGTISSLAQLEELCYRVCRDNAE